VAVHTIDGAQLAYDALADAYDALTADYRHDLWLDRLEALGRRHGLDGRRALDVACGTGKSFLPLLERGWEVTAFDVSPEMAARAAAKAPQAEVLVGDMRDPGVLGAFDLVTCLDDALNYLLEPDDLAAALSGIAANLAPGGVALWDLNTLAMYRTAFASDWICEREGRFMAWHGLTPATLAAGEEAAADVDVFASGEEGWQRITSRHRQRHWPREVVVELAAGAGLEVREVLGQHRGALLEPGLDESVHTKAVYVARHSERG
jgi:SAM-dependent methyltransferase